MNQIQLIPLEIQCIIPQYDGDEKLLKLFLSKCEYVINNFRDANNPAQETYLYHCITSRLVGKAAVIVSEREHNNTWDGLKELFVQNFGDNRTEACIAMELEGMTIYHGESYTDFYHRIHNAKRLLIAKVNLLTDESLKSAKKIIYEDMAFNVFLYNLSEDLLRTVRLKKCTTLDTALNVVKEEMEFQKEFKARNQFKQRNNQNVIFKPFRPPVQTQPQIPFGMPNNQYTGGAGLFGATASQPQSRGFGLANQKPASVTGFGAQGSGATFGSSSQPPKMFNLGNSTSSSFSFGTPLSTTVVSPNDNKTSNVNDQQVETNVNNP